MKEKQVVLSNNFVCYGQDLGHAFAAHSQAVLGVSFIILISLVICSPE